MSGESAWADALQALSLLTADPVGLGGICIRAAAGPVRQRFLTLLYRALPPDMPVRRMPLNIADDRLLGGLDLAATLSAGRPVMQRGLLAEADGGIVILAMAERIGIAAAARLCAAIDSGAVTLQRDGLSQVMPARFGIVALDEGADAEERPPSALLDRLAFHIDLTEVSWFEAAASDQAPLPDPIGRPNDQAVEALCHAAAALGIDSTRAPLLALRAARLAASRNGRTTIEDPDLALAARLVFAPRATRLPATQESPPPTPPEPETTETEPQILPDKPLDDIVLDAAKAAIPADLLARLASLDGGRGLVRTPGRAGQIKLSLKRGRPIGIRHGEPRNGARLHILETLKAAAPWQKLRHRTTRLEVRRDDFRIIQFRQRIGTTTIFVVDASGSAALHRLAEAKGAVELLLADCYVRRDQVALIAFRGTAATLLLPPTGSLLRAKRNLAALPGGGPTPLAAGIEAAHLLADTIRRGGRTPVITLLTDARANMTRDGTGGRPQAESEAIQAAHSLAAASIATMLIDTSPRPNPFAKRLAGDMRAQYLPLPYADANALSAAVRSAAA